MRGIPVTLMLAIQKRFPGSNRKFLRWFLIILLLLSLAYALLFHFFMYLEDRSYSFITGIYWTLVVLSTQGFGDIVFTSDPGKIFTIIVNLTGIVFMLVLLPFVIIQFVYKPIMTAQKEANAPRSLPNTMKGHVLLTNYGPLEEAFVERLKSRKIPYAIIVEDVNEAYKLTDMGFRVAVGNLRSPQTYEAVQVQQAALVCVTSPSDPINTNIVFVVRQVSENVPIVSLSNVEESIDILELAGSTEVFDIGDLMGKSLARSSSNEGTGAHVMGKIEDLRIVEARASGTDLVGKTLREAALGQKMQVTVIGVWERGRFDLAGPDTRIAENSILVMAMSDEQLTAYNSTFSTPESKGYGVLILGAGNVGIAAARYLREKGTPFTIIDKEEPPPRVAKEFSQNIVIGDAADYAFLKSTIFFEASAVLVTTHNDDINIYLSLYFRKLRPDIQLLARANNESNVASLHRAGADFVLSTATTAATLLFNHLAQGHIYTMVEGLYAIQIKIPEKMVGKSLVNLQFRALTGCSIIAMLVEGRCIINPSPFEPLPDKAEIIMVLTPDAEAKFFKYFMPNDEKQNPSMG